MTNDIPPVRQGRPPEEGEPKQRQQFMLEPALIRRVEALARANDRTLSAQYRLLILDALRQSRP